MKGVVLAGGLGTRLRPLTLITNKHLLPVFNQPMIFYPIKTLLRAGIDEIMIVTGGPHAGHFISVLQNGKHLGIKHLEYAYQEKEGGILDALRLAEDFADCKPITVILGDNCTDADISKSVRQFKKGAMVFLKKVADPARFGVPVFEPINKTKKTTKITPKTHRIVKIEEKPKKPKSEYAVTGLYIYDSRIFEFIKKCKPSPRGELEITDANNLYIQAGTLQWTELKGFWQDAGTFESLFKVNAYWAKKHGIIFE